MTPQLGGPALRLPADLHRSLKPGFTLCTCPPPGSAFWDVIVADSGQHSVSKARSLTESAEWLAGQTEGVTRTPGLQASPSAPPVPTAAPLLFPGGSDSKESACSAGDPDSTPGWGRSPGEGHGNPLLFLPGESRGQRSLVGYSPWGCMELDMTEHRPRKSNKYI